MLARQNNHAFIDGTNLHKSLQRSGLQINHAKFRQYLREKLGITKAYYFLGYVGGNEGLYADLQAAGYTLVTKPTLQLASGLVKGNCDTELVLTAATTLDSYDQGVLVSNDGDFTCLIRYWKGRGQFKSLIASSRDNCSRLLRVAAEQRVIYVDEASVKVGLKRIEGKHCKDGTLQPSPSS